jgi:RNA polymerase sigma-70 factor, ECF subfamily
VSEGDGEGTELLPTRREFVSRPRMGRVADEATLLALYDANQRDLYRFTRALVRETETAEDIVAEAFARLIREVRAGRAPDDARGWLFRVAANLVVTAGRRRAVAVRFLPRLAAREVAEAADAPALRGERQAELLSALGHLPADHRAALLLAAHGFSGREIATAIGRTEPAVRTLLSRARLDLRHRLQGLERDR